MRLPANFETFRRLFALRNYRFYMAGVAASNVGVWVQRVAIGWLTWELTESTAWLGGIAIAEAAPMIVLGLVAGTVVDRMDYLRLLRITQATALLYSAALAALTFSGLMTIWLLLVISILRGATMAFQRPSRMSLVFTLIGRELLPTGLALNSMVFNGSRFVGPAIGGAIIVVAGIGWAFVAAWALFFLFTLALRRLSVPVAPRRAREGSFAAESWEGVRYIAAHPGIRMQMAVLLATAFFARPLIDLFPGFAAQVFAGGPETLASLMSALGLGAVGGGLYLSGRRGGTRGMTAVTLGAMGAASLALLAFAATDALWLALPLAALLGMALIVLGIGNQTLIQSAVEPALRGRVISLYGTAARATPSVGALIIGALAETTGLRLPVAAGALLCLAVWAWAWRRRRAYAENLEGEPAAGSAPLSQGDEVKSHRRFHVESDRRNPMSSSSIACVLSLGEVGDMTTTIAVVGATGAQGGGLARAILNDPDKPFRVRALIRNPGSDKARQLAGAGAEVVAADLDDPASLAAAFRGADAAFCVTNYWEHFSPERELAQAANMARAAKDAGLRHVVWSTLEDTRRRVPLTDDRMPTLMGKYKVPHFDAKGEADGLFAKMGVPTTFLLTSFYWDNFIYFGLGPKRGADGVLAITLPMGEAKLPGIAAEDIGRCAYGIFKGGPAFIGKTVGIAGEHLTGGEMAAAMGKALGQTVRYNAVSPETYRGFGFPGADDLGNMFQFKRDFNDTFCAARPVDGARKLNPALQTFAAWLESNKARIPLE